MTTGSSPSAAVSTPNGSNSSTLDGKDLAAAATSGKLVCVNCEVNWHIGGEN